MFGRKVRDAVDDYANFLAMKISDSSAAANEWETALGGGMKTAGVNGNINGRGADLFLVDDPYSGFADANSPTIQESVWNWWGSVAYPRQQPGCNIVIIHTRWSENDLTGKLLAQEEERRKAGEPLEGWVQFSLPAIAENLGTTDGVPVKDVIGRVDGEALWPEQFPLERLKRIQSAIGPTHWRSLYQQSPMPPDGVVFQRSWVEPYRYSIVRQNNDDPEQDRVVLAPRNTQHTAFDTTLYTSFAVSEMETFLISDTAMTTKKENDPSCCICFWKTPRRHLLIKEIFVGRLNSPQVEKKILEMYKRHRCAFMGIEAKNNGLVAIQRFLDLDLVVKPLKADADKLSRSTPLQIMMEHGKVWFPDASILQPEYWTMIFDQLMKFPRGKHDDIVDTLSYGARLMTEYTYDTDGPPAVIDMVEAEHSDEASLL